jgi:phage shock protein C
MEHTHRLLQRNIRDRKIGGVAAGLGDYFGVDPTIVRLAFVLLVLAGGIGLVAYLVAWLVMPAGDGSTDSASPSRTGSSTDERSILGAVILSVGLLGLIGWAGIWWFDGFAFWALAFVAVGVALLLWRRDDGGPPPPDAPGPPDAPRATPPEPESPALESPALESPSEDKTEGHSPDDDAGRPGALSVPEAGTN